MHAIYMYIRVVGSWVGVSESWWRVTAACSVQRAVHGGNSRPSSLEQPTHRPNEGAGTRVYICAAEARARAQEILQVCRCRCSRHGLQASEYQVLSTEY